MDIQVPSHAMKQGYVLAPHEIDSLKQSLGAYSQMLGASDAYANALDGAAPVNLPGLRINRGRITEQAKQAQKVLSANSPEPVKPEEKDKLFKRAEALKEIFLPWLETRAELSVKKRDRSEWQSATLKAQKRTFGNSAYDPSIETAINEWKYIMRRLEPGNPNADNLHNLRKDR